MEAIRSNLRTIRSMVNPGVRLVVVVKAGWPAGTLINVNFPGCPAAAVKGDVDRYKDWNELVR